MTKFENLQVGDLVIPTVGKYKGTFVVVTQTKYKDTNEISGVAFTDLDVLYFKNELSYPTSIEQKAYDTLLAFLNPNVILARHQHTQNYFLVDTVTGDLEQVSTYVVNTLFERIPLAHLGETSNLHNRPVTTWRLPTSVRMQLYKYNVIKQKRGTRV